MLRSILALYAVQYRSCSGVSTAPHSPVCTFPLSVLAACIYQRLFYQPLVVLLTDSYTLMLQMLISLPNSLDV